MEKLHQLHHRGSWVPATVLDRTALVLGVAILIAQAFFVAADPGKYQFDLTPYIGVQGGVLYPPYRPLLLAPLRYLAPLAAYYVFLIAKCAAIAFAVWLMARQIAPAERGRFVLFSAVGFNFALGIDLRAGNIATFELILVLLGFGALMRERLRAAAALLLAAGLFKIILLALLGTLLLSRRNDRFAVFGASVVVALLALLLPLLLDPNITGGAAVIASQFDTMRGPIDSSLLALCQDIVTAIGNTLRDPSHRMAPEQVERLALALYGTIALAIAFVGCRSLNRLRRADSATSPSDPPSSPFLRAALLYSCVLYALCAPRLVTYTQSIVLLPVFALVSARGGSTVSKALLLAGFIPTQQILNRVCGRPQDAALGPWWILPIEYWSWFLLLVIWILVTKDILSRPMVTSRLMRIPE